MTLAYSRGGGINDNKPRQVRADSFADLVAALDRDRAPKKESAAYVCGPLNGDGRRCADGALPRRFLAVDADRIDAAVHPDFRMWFARFSAVGWSTHSSKPDAPRERILIETDRDMTREENMAVGAALARDLAEEFGQSVEIDHSTFRGEQPVFVPPAGVTLARFSGEPLRVDEYLQAAPAAVPAHQGTKQPAGDAIEEIGRGEHLHENIARLVAQMAAKGVDRAVIRAAAVGLAEHARHTRGARVDQFTGDELQRLIDGALQKFAPQDGDRSEPFEQWPTGHITGLFETAPPAVERFAGPLLADRAHVLPGIGGTSKTRVLYHLAAGAVLGHLPWDWTVERTGSAALFLTEDTLADAHRMLHAMGASLSADQRRQLEDRMRVYPLAGRAMRLLTLNGNALYETECYDWLTQQIAALPQPVAFIGLDPALAITEGNELEQAHQRRLGELVDRIAIEARACVVLSAHATKGSLQADEIGSHQARGGGALTDAVRGEIALRTMTAEEARRYGITDIVERKRLVQMQLTKANHAPPEAFAPIWLKRGIGGTLSQVSLDQVERGAVGPRELQALELLKRTAAQGDTTMRFWRAECEAAGVIPASATDSAKEKAMQRIRDTLHKACLVAPGSVKGSWVPA